MGNSLNVRDQKTLDELWSLFSGLQVCAFCMYIKLCHISYYQSKSGESAAVATDKEDTSISVDAADDVAEVDGGKKKKHKKHQDDVLESVTLAKEDVKESVSKKKKKERSATTDVTNGEPEFGVNNHLDIQLLSDSQLPMSGEGETKKKKKSKKKRSLGNVIWFCALICK